METECPGCDDLLREVDRLRARLAAVEAERDQWHEELTASEKWRHDTTLEREYFKARLADLRAKLAAVRDLCEAPGGDPEAFLQAVLALIDQEDDRD